MLLDKTGCKNCLTDLLELQARNDMCSGIAGGQAACEAKNTPCNGEPLDGAPAAAPGEAPSSGTR
jgi:hypothetical protein